MRGSDVTATGQSSEEDRPPPATRIQTYLNELSTLHCASGRPLVSIVLFGSAAKGAFTEETSDVDLIIVLPDGTTPPHRTQIRNEVRAIEVAHGFRPPESHRKSILEKFAERAAGHAMSCFICSRGDLLSGDVARVLDLAPAEAIFVDRMVLASIFMSAVTVWGEDLLPQVRLLPLRTIDVFKALFNFLNITTMSAIGFLLLPDTTRYAMGALKHSLHSCYFCYHLTNAPLEQEVQFFNRICGNIPMLQTLLEQRRGYKRSFAFILRCPPTLLRLHFSTWRDNQFPKPVTRTAAASS